MLPTMKRFPAKVLTSASMPPRIRMFGKRKQEHHCRDIRDQIGKNEGRAEQYPPLVQVDTQRRKIGDCLGSNPGVMNGMIHDEQAGEQHQQFPIDQTDHHARMQAATHQQQPRGGQCHMLTRPRREQEGNEQEADHDQAFSGLPGIQGHGRVRWRPNRNGVSNRRLRPFAARLQDNQPPDRAQAQRHRKNRLREISGKRQLQRLSDQHVLWVADERRRRTDIGRTRQCQEIRDRVEPPFLAGADQHRGACQTDDVVAEHGRQGGNYTDQHSKQQWRRQRKAGDASRDPVIEPAQPHLGRQHHEGKEEDHGRQVDRIDRPLKRDRIHADHGDGAEQGDTGSIKLQEWQAAKDHPDINDHKNGDDDSCHGNPGFT